VIGYGKSDVGKIRANNEDAIYVNNDGLGALSNLFVVADGMGGHNAGEVASGQAVLAFCEFFAENTDFVLVQDLLTDGLAFANGRIYEGARQVASFSGMGTTLTACCADDENLYYTHVGDSRIYIISDDGMHQLTRDDSLVADMVEKGEITKDEARSHPEKNVLTRAVGTDRDVDISKGYISIAGINNVLLCSDGLTDMLSDDEILDVMKTADTMADKAENLVARALEAGGDDNISVIVAGWMAE